MILILLIIAIWNIIEEYLRIFLFAIPPTLFFILALMLSNNYPEYFHAPFPPFIILALLSGLSCFIFGTDEAGGYFQTFQSYKEKGFRLMMVKILEMSSEQISIYIFQHNPVPLGIIDNNFRSDGTWKTCLALYCLSVLTIAGLRTVIIYPYAIFITKWTSRIPSPWYPLEKEAIIHLETIK